MLMQHIPKTAPGSLTGWSPGTSHQNQFNQIKSTISEQENLRTKATRLLTDLKSSGEKKLSLLRDFRPPVAKSHNYTSLDAEKIIETTRHLSQRIEERFPGSSLGQVSLALVREAEDSISLTKWLAKPLRSVRLLTATAIVGLTVPIGVMLTSLNNDVELFSSLSDFFQGLDAGINGIILFGGAVYYLVNLEATHKRDTALNAIKTLREMAHIIDMHQLTKDPESLSGYGPNTASSPERHMTAFELTRYLNYSSEMLALISKIAALHVQGFQDPVVLSAVDEVQDLTNGLSHKMWQKIMILDRIMRNQKTQNTFTVS